jgi:hypothetical protein
MHQATDSLAVLEIRPDDCALSAPPLDQSELYGPLCRTARTLPATHAVRLAPTSGDARITIPDPCYWSPEMPFLYEWISSSQEGRTEHHRRFGLRNLVAHRQSLRRGGRRIVLRGYQVSELDEPTLNQAHQACCSVWTALPSHQVMALAASMGVSLIVDLSHPTDTPKQNLKQLLADLSWQCAVEVVVLSREQLRELGSPPGARSPGNLLIAQALTLDDSPESVSGHASVVTLELAPGEVPPAWIGHTGRPVLVAGRQAWGGAASDARRACERLQARCAPKFDLAGYVVAT